MVWTENPPSRPHRLIDYLEAQPLENDEVQAKTAFLMFRSHLEIDHQLHCGCRGARFVFAASHK
jgi:hypothetical protein